MSALQLTAEDLLIGAENIFEVAVPHQILQIDRPDAVPSKVAEQTRVVLLRPLTIGAFQLIMKAAKQDPGLIPLLMIKESLVQPVLSLEQIKRLPLGLVNFLIDQIRQISGLTGKKTSSMS